jgi:hypothetical protein
MVVAVSLLEDVVYDSRGCYAGLDDGESVWIVDVARNRVRVTAPRVIRTGRSIMRNIVFSYASRDQNHHSGNYDRRDSLFQELTSRIDASKGVVVGKTFLTRARVPSYRRSNAHDAVVLTEL